MGRIHLASIASLTALWLTSVTSGANAQVVQLPTFRVFSMSTTVSVPDRGSAYLGGVTSSSTSRRERGLPGLGHVPIAGRPFGNRSISSHTRAGGVSVSAHIHDFEAMDEALLRQAGAAVRRAPVATHSRDVAGRSSITDLRRQNTADQRAERTAARRDFDHGLELLNRGRPDMAKVYFRQAARRGDAELRAEIAGILRTQPSAGPLAHSVVRAAQPR
jgi:hypothetical protein